jgi:hypothetical protein
MFELYPTIVTFTHVSVVIVSIINFYLNLSVSVVLVWAAA